MDRPRTDLSTQARPSLWDTPWKATNEVRRILTWPMTRAYIALCGIQWRRRWRIYGRPVIQRQRGSRIAIGEGLQMRNWLASNPLGVDHACILATRSGTASIEIGRDVSISGGAICAAQAIRIGDRVTVGANSTIVDTDFHPLDALRRATEPLAGKSAPVTIEDDVFIGTRVIILKGSHVGHAAVIGAGSVVSGEVPPEAVVAGNPARVVRRL